MDRHRLPWGNHQCEADLARREASIAVKLDAWMLSGLYERLLEIKGLCLHETYKLCWLLDVGGQGILYLAEDLRYDNAPILVKLPFLPYHKPGEIDLASIERGRADLWREADILTRFPGTILPEFYDALEASNPLHHPAWGSELIQREPYLIMEYIQGISLAEVIGHHHATQPPPRARLEQLAWSLTRHLLELWETMWAQGGFLYTDLRPTNLMVAQQEDGRGTPHWRRRSVPSETPLPRPKTDTDLRLIDAGSVVRQSVATTFPYHPAYLPPAIHQALLTGEPVVPDPALVCYTLGKTLFQLLTNHEPLPDQTPDLTDPELQSYSTPLRTMLAYMLDSSVASFQEAQRMTASFSALCIE